MKRAELGQPGLIGKHPSRGDFVGLGRREHEFTSFDAFLTHNMEWAEQHAGARWEQAYRSAEIFAFAYRPTEGGRASALVGAIGTSEDRAGRRYPLSAAMPLFASPELFAAPELLPLALESCWQATSQVIASLAAEPDSGIAHSFASLVELPLDVDEALASYAEWTRRLPAEELWALIFGEKQPGIARALALVGDAIETCRNIEKPTTPLSLRLPLGRAGGAAVCFWLDWVRSITHWRATLPTFFWSHDGERGTLLLNLGSPPRCTLAELWLPTGTRDEICDITGAPESLSVDPGQVRRWAALVEGPPRTVASLLHAVHTLQI